MIDKVSMKNSWPYNQQSLFVFIRLNDDIMNISFLPPCPFHCMDLALHPGIPSYMVG